MILFLLILAVIILGGSYYSYRIAFYSPPALRGKTPSVKAPQYDPYRPRMREIYRALADRPCEIVTIRSHDGLTLSARYYHVADGAPLDICCHGYKSHPFTDFSGGSQLCFAMGHNVLLIDQRAQHNSQGKCMTFGILERYDVLDWVNYAIDRFGSELKITLYGVSMGGATLLMAAELPLPENVKGIVADGPFAVPVEIILDVGRKLHYPQNLIRPFLYIAAWLYGGFRLGETDAVKAVKNTKVPIVILHGEADSYVPCAMSEPVALANPHMVRRYTFPGAEHAISYLVDTERYSKIVTEFSEEILR